jgi:hypothetical protein
LSPLARIALTLLLLVACGVCRAQSSPSTTPDESTVPEDEDKKEWLDRAQQDLYNSVWNSAMRLDRIFGSQEPDVAYQQASGSLAPGLLWDTFNGLRTLLRFHADLPLPQLNESFSAFIGRTNPLETVSEAAPSSGAIPNQFGPQQQDQTLFGIAYNQPQRQGGRFDAGAGVHVALPLDPYLKGSYIYELGSPDHGVFGWRETVFYENSQGGVGVTSRLDFDRLVTQQLLFHWTGSTTLAQRSYGWATYSTFDALYAFPNRRAFAAELEIDGDLHGSSSHDVVPLHDFGAKVAYRRSVLRDWLILEVRTSLDWPKDFPTQDRKINPGVGVGFEIFFGTDEFLARPITF